MVTVFGSLPVTGSGPLSNYGFDMSKSMLKRNDAPSFEHQDRSLTGATGATVLAEGPLVRTLGTIRAKAAWPTAGPLCRFVRLQRHHGRGGSRKVEFATVFSRYCALYLATTKDETKQHEMGD